ncbi:MAG: DUF4911 domain-containing protein [Caldimicrobium sp.]
MNKQILQSSFKLITITPSSIAFLKFLFEGYDHLALLSVLDRKKALVQITYYPTEEKIVETLLEDFKNLIFNSSS